MKGRDTQKKREKCFKFKANGWMDEWIDGQMDESLSSHKEVPYRHWDQHGNESISTYGTG